MSLLEEHYWEKATNLFGKLCETKANLRYQCSNALMHPWITRDENGTIPLNFHDQIEKTNKLYDKFKGIQNLILSVAVLRDKLIKKNKDSLLDEYKYQIVKEEYLDFTPTPKKENKD